MSLGDFRTIREISSDLKLPASLYFEIARWSGDNAPHMRLGLFLSIFFGVSVLFMGLGLLIALSQARKLTAYLPTKASVLSRRITNERDRHGSVTHRPVVNYRYAISGKEYTCSDVTVMSFSSSGDWAAQTIAKFPPGAQVTAYYDPENPSHAFLVKSADFFPYIFILFPMLHFTLAAGLLMWNSTRWPRVKPPVRSERGWFEINPVQSIRARFSMWLILSLLWYGVGAASFWHYTQYAARPFPLEAIIAMWAYPILGLIPIGGSIYFAILMRESFDAIALVSTGAFSLGDTFEARMIYPLRQDVDIEILVFSLICERNSVGGHRRNTVTTAWGKDVNFAEDRSVRTGETLDFSTSFTIPRDGFPSNRRGDPRYTWKLVCQASLKNSPDYRAEFLIDVKAMKVPSVANSTLHAAP